MLQLGEEFSQSQIPVIWDLRFFQNQQASGIVNLVIK